MLKQEIQYLLAALQFFTRVPLPVGVAHDSVTLNQALRYFPLIGWLVGGACGLAYHLAAGTWPAPVAVVLSIIVGVLLTGALHEDGFADSCDGFGGGWNKAQVLAIMKDARIGNYAALGLILLLLLKTVLLIQLAQLGEEALLIALLLAHSASRLLVLPLPWLLDYVRESADSKSQAMVAQRFSGSMLAYASLFVLLPLLFLQAAPLWYALLNAVLATTLMGAYFKRRLGGYSGDCLGAAQQVSEVVIYLSLLGTWNSL